MKEGLAKFYRVVGAPHELASWGVVGSLASGNLIHLMWAVPLWLITLPLFPFYTMGEELTTANEKERFAQETAHLPRMSDVPDDHLYLGQYSEDGSWLTAGGEYGPYETEEELREAVAAAGYHEVIDESNEDHHLWGTCWVR